MRFGSPEWIAAAVEALRARPELPEALRGLGRDVAFVIGAEPPAWPSTVAVWAEQVSGRIGRWRILDDEDEVLELEPAYVVRAPYGAVRSVLRGADPVQAALSGRIRVEGDLEALVRRARYGHLVKDVLAVVPTELP